MKHSAILLSFLAAGALCLAPACNDHTEAGSGDGQSASTDQAAAPAAEEAPAEAESVGDAAALERRAAERWQLIEKEDWIQSYDYLAPQLRRQQPLGEYLSGSTDHHYIVKTNPAFIARDDRLGYLQVIVEWTPTHAELATAANVDDGSLTQDIDMTETWGFHEGEWYFLKAQRSSDFRKQNPKVFRRDREEK